MTVPRPDQTVHMMGWVDILRELRNMRRKEPRNALELRLYTTDDLRRFYQAGQDDLYRLRDGIVTRNQLVAVILWRVLCDRFGYFLLLGVSVIAAIAAVVAAVEGWPRPK